MPNVILIKHPINWGLQSRLVEDAANEALISFGYEKNVELSIVFIGRKKAKDLNIKYRQKNYVPQVLGFPMSKTKDGDGLIRLGDIVICSQKLKYEVKFQKKSIEFLLRDWIRHGVENLIK